MDVVFGAVDGLDRFEEERRPMDSVVVVNSTPPPTPWASSPRFPISPKSPRTGETCSFRLPNVDHSPGLAICDKPLINRLLPFASCGLELPAEIPPDACPSTLRESSSASGVIAAACTPGLLEVSADLFLPLGLNPATAEAATAVSVASSGSSAKLSSHESGSGRILRSTGTRSVGDGMDEKTGSATCVVEGVGGTVVVVSVREEDDMVLVLRLRKRDRMDDMCTYVLLYAAIRSQ